MQYFMNLEVSLVSLVLASENLSFLEEKLLKQNHCRSKAMAVRGIFFCSISSSIAKGYMSVGLELVLFEQTIIFAAFNEWIIMLIDILVVL